MAIANGKGAGKKVSEILDEKTKEKKEKTHAVMVYFPESLFQELKRCRYEEDISMSAILRDAFEQRLKRNN